MPKACEICGRGPDFGHNVSHSGKKTKRKRKPNLQKIKVWHEGKKKKTLVCTRCIKAGKVQKAI